MQFDSGLSRSGTCHSNQGKVIRVMTLDLPPLFSAGCRLTGGAKPYVMGLAGLEATYRITHPHLRDLAPLTREPVRHRTIGWLTGGVGVALGEQSPTRITTAGINGLLLQAGLSGRLQVWQDGRHYDTNALESWVLFNELPAQAQTSASSGVMISLRRDRLLATFDTMMGVPSGKVCPHTQVLSLQTPSVRRAHRDLPLLLHLARDASRHWPDGVRHAEDSIYRLVSRLLAPVYVHSEARGPGRQAREHRAVDLACGFMQSQIDRALTLTEVEAVVGLSTRALQSAFVLQLGVSPMAWLKEQRLLLAHHLIRSGGAESVSTAALASGLNHFGRFAVDFRARFGLTPQALSRESRPGHLH